MKKKHTFKSPYLAGICLLALAATALYLSNDQRRHERRTSCKNDEKTDDHEEVKLSQKGPIPGCDLFSGRWVYDNPLYKEGQCTLMQEYFACEKNGRKDLKYQHWRWKPHGCYLPRFNGTAFLAKIRGKKLVFVGDSLNRNQWVSLLCLIELSIPPSSLEPLTYEGNFINFHSTEYNATIAFYWSPLLVESNCDNPNVHRERNRVIRITSIEKHARQWTGADILIFNSFMWWLEPTMTILYGEFGSPDAIYKKVEMEQRRYEMALNTWSDWLEININRTQTKMFFMSLSPFHFHGETMDDDKGCHGQNEPIQRPRYRGIETDHRFINAAESTIQKLEERGVKLQYLNITQLSDHRIDGHPSIHNKLASNLTEEQIKNPKSYSDCVHWCLPGVPDAWNEILYTYIINS